MKFTVEWLSSLNIDNEFELSILNAKTGQEVMTLLHELNNKGQTIVLITHEKEIAEQTERTIFIRDGKIESDSIN